MRKFFVGFAFFCFLFFAKGAKTVQAAVTDVSDNVVSLDVDKKKAWFNGDFVHVQAKFNDKKQTITANGVMKIMWENTQEAFLQGIGESGKLIIQDEEGKGHEVGHYTVDTNGVVILFNDQVEKFKDITGQIDFDLQVKNKSERSQDLIIETGELTKNLHVVGQNRPSTDIDAITIDGNYNQDYISWEINIDPKKAEYVQFEVENIIPEGLSLDGNSLKVRIANREIKLDKDNFQIVGNKLKLNLDDRKYQGPISIIYDTQVKDPVALSALNQVAVRYQLNDDKKINENIYGGKIKNETVVNIDGKTIVKQPYIKKEDQTNKESTEAFFERLAALIAEKKKTNVESERKEQNKDLKVNDTPAVTSLTGFDSQSAEIAAPKTSKNTNDSFKTVEDKILKNNDDPKEIRLEKKNRHESRTSSTSLPKAGESTSIIMSIAGLFILILGALTLGLKRRSR